MGELSWDSLPETVGGPGERGTTGCHLLPMLLLSMAHVTAAVEARRPTGPDFKLK